MKGRPASASRSTAPSRAESRRGGTGSSSSGGPETALQFRSAEQLASFTWVDDKIGYVVSGPADRAKLEAVTKTVYEQIDKSAPKKS